ncbi:MAG: MaoC family dehydratase N-terminal domain-containing protein [Clostridiales bacterium]|nr:MaoC family dehydratase N-terminal domain-containing protein [Clostridiales bacterium]
MIKERNEIFSFSVQITAEMQRAFADLSGDENPLHIDREFAREKGYPDVLAYGMLTASFYSRLVGVYLPGRHSVFQECSISFNKPVFIGDSLCVSGKVACTHDVLNLAVIKAEIRNQKNERVSTAKLTVGVRAPAVGAIGGASLE